MLVMNGVKRVGELQLMGQQERGGVSLGSGKKNICVRVENCKTSDVLNLVNVASVKVKV